MKDFFGSKAVGFYVSAASVVLSLATLLVYALYGTVGGGAQYFSPTALVLLIVSILAFCGMCIFRVTAPWASFVQAVFLFASFLVCLYSCYMYFSEVFYGGITERAFELMNKYFLFSLILYLLSVLTSQVGAQMRQIKKPETTILGYAGNEWK